MWEDPIVEEVHRTREKLAAKYNFDVKAMFAALREREASLGGRLVPQRKRAETTFEAGRARHSASAGSAPTEGAPASCD
jgi:hypothetical protein